MIRPKADHSEPANVLVVVRQTILREIHAQTIPIEGAEIGRGQATLERLLCAHRAAAGVQGDSRATLKRLLSDFRRRPRSHCRGSPIVHSLDHEKCAALGGGSCRTRGTLNGVNPLSGSVTLAKSGVGNGDRLAGIGDEAEPVAWPGHPQPAGGPWRFARGDGGRMQVVENAFAPVAPVESPRG